MKVSYLCDEQKGAGYGFFSCSGESFAAGNYNLCLQRAVDKCFLSPLCEKADERWIESRTVFAIAGTLSAQGDLLLPLEPGIVNVLSTQDTYRLSLSEQGGKSLTAQFRIESINYSAEDSLNNAQVMAAPKIPEQVKAEPKPLAEPEPIVVPQPAAPAKSGKKSLFFVLAALLLLALAGFLAWFFLMRDVPPKDVPAHPSVTEQSGKDEETQGQIPPEQSQKQEPDPLQQALPEPAQGQETDPLQQALPEPAQGQETDPLQQVQPEPAQGQEPHPSPQTPPEPEPSPAPSPIISVEDQVQTFFADRQRTAARAVELSQSLAHNSPSEQDAIFRLYYFAAQQGERQILLDYAACFDPTKPAWGTIEKDALEAYRLYEEAKASQPEAEQRQKELKNWLEEAAKGGNAQAKMWLSQLPK